MASINLCDQSKLFENISKFMIISDQMNEHVYNGLAHFIMYINSRIQRCVYDNIP